MTIALTTDFKNNLVNHITGKGTFSKYLGLSGSRLYFFSTAEANLTYVDMGSKFGAPNNGVAVLSNAPVNFTVGSSVTIGRAEWTDSNGTGAISYLSVGLTGSGADVILSTLTPSAGQTVSILACSMKFLLSVDTVKVNSIFADNLLSRILFGSNFPMAFGSSSNVKVYSGTPPENAGQSPTGTLLADFAISGTNVYNSAADGSASLVSSLTTNGVATGTAGYVRWVSGSYVWQLSVGVDGSGEDVILSSLSIESGQPVSITNMTIAM